MELGEPEIQDLCMLAGSDEDVGRLDVAMDNARLIGGIQPVGDFDCQWQQFHHRHWFAADALLERLTLHEFHCDVGATILLADVVDGADVWMIESRGGPGFAAEAAKRIPIRRHFGGQEFDGRKASQTNVLGLVHDAHAAAAERAQQTIRTDPLAGGLRYCMGLVH